MVIMHILLACSFVSIIHVNNVSRVCWVSLKYVPPNFLTTSGQSLLTLYQCHNKSCSGIQMLPLMNSDLKSSSSFSSSLLMITKPCSSLSGSWLSNFLHSSQSETSIDTYCLNWPGISFIENVRHSHVYWMLQVYVIITLFVKLMSSSFADISWALNQVYCSSITEKNELSSSKSFSWSPSKLIFLVVETQFYKKYNHLNHKFIVQYQW